MQCVIKLKVMKPVVDINILGNNDKSFKKMKKIKHSHIIKYYFKSKVYTTLHSSLP